jgi:hypothetical protein
MSGLGFGLGGAGKSVFSGFNDVPMAQKSAFLRGF